MFEIFSFLRNKYQMDTCILLSTCDKYTPLAKLTINLIKKRWRGHPPIFVCGVSNTFFDGVEILPLLDDPKDWIGITGRAVDYLLENGYKKSYLILEDHPPLDECNHNHLNKTLPQLMDKLNAAYIGLYGWDQGALSDGSLLSIKYYFLQHQAASFLWRFSLHPALWSLKALQDSIALLPIEKNDINTHSIWAFERRLGRIEDFLWSGETYRVFGLGMLAGRFRTIRALVRGSYFYFLNVVLWLIARMFGSYLQTRFSLAILGERLFFDGPYPLYWSGVMQKGKLNLNFEKYLIRRKKIKELDEFKYTMKLIGDV